MTLLKWMSIAFGSGCLPSVFGNIGIGDLAFCIFGCRSVLNFNHGNGGTIWLEKIFVNNKNLSLNNKFRAIMKRFIVIIIAEIIGISLFCFGGGLIRDPLLGLGFFHFIELKQLVIISIIILIYSINHFLFSAKKLKKIRKIAFILLVASDVYGLHEFALLGQARAINVLASNYLLVFISGIASQLGGGIIASFIRHDFKSTVRNNLFYYVLAVTINIFLFINRGLPNKSSLLCMLPLFILAGLIVNDTSCEIILIIFKTLSRKIQVRTIVLTKLISTVPYSSSYNRVYKYIKQNGQYRWSNRIFRLNRKQINLDANRKQELSWLSAILAELFSFI